MKNFDELNDVEQAEVLAGLWKCEFVDEQIGIYYERVIHGTVICGLLSDDMPLDINSQVVRLDTPLPHFEKRLKWIDPLEES